MKKHIWHPLPSHPELLIGQYIVPNFVSNSVAIKVSEQEFIIISPGEKLLDSWPDEYKGEHIKLHLIMNNAWHFMGIAPWQKAFKHTELYASKQAIPLLQKKDAGQGRSILSLEDHGHILPPHYELLIPPGHRGGDVWLQKTCEQTGEATWITCDSFLNYDRLSNQPIARFMQKLLGAAPGLKISQVIKYFLLTGRGSFKNWVLHQLANKTVTTLIPSHGEVAQDNKLSQQLTRLVKQRL